MCSYLLVVLSCQVFRNGDKNELQASLQVNIQLQSRSKNLLRFEGSANQVTQLKIQVTRQGVPLVDDFQLGQNNGAWSGRLPALPVGPVLTITGYAYNQPGEIIFSGSSEYSLTGDSDNLQLKLEPASNETPMGGLRIIQIEKAKGTVVDDTSTLLITIDGVPGQTITYQIVSGSDRFAPSIGEIILDQTPKTTELIYHAPSQRGKYPYSLKISNEYQDSVETSFEMEVVYAVQGDCLNRGAAPIGMNLDFTASWSPHVLFVDAMKKASPWTSNVADQSDPRSWEVWDTSVDIPLRDDGYPLELPYYPTSGPYQGVGQLVSSLIYNAIDGLYPTGTYTLIFEGSGTIFLGDIGESLVFENGGTYPVPVTQTSYYGIRLEIRRSDINDPIRKIHLILPGYENVYQTQPFYPKFIELLKGFNVLRPVTFSLGMNIEYPCDNPVDPTHIDCVMDWEHRVQPTYYTQSHSRRGMAWEYIIDMANHTKADLWVNVPHAATDNYMRELADLLKRRLAPNKQIYLEFSNETWNSSFPPREYFKNKGMALHFNDDWPYEASTMYFIKRTVEMWTIFEEVFGMQSARIVKTLPSQGTLNSWQTETRINYLSYPLLNPEQKHADALAVAAYFGYIADGFVENNEVDSITPDQMLDRIEADFDNLVQYIEEGRQTAHQNDMRFITYEAGQHFATYAYQDNTTLITKMLEAHRSDRWYSIMKSFLDLWDLNFPDELLMLFSFMRRPDSNNGCSWGFLEYMDQPLSEAHKYRAVKERICGD